MGPPVVTRRWSAAQVKEGIADDGVRRLGDLAPHRARAGGRARRRAAARARLAAAGGPTGGFAAGQPQYLFQIPLAGRTEDDVLKGMNQLWRRNIKKADKSGVEVTSSTSTDDLKAFHDLYVHTAERDHFTPRPLAYFRTMVEALSAEQPRPDHALVRPPRGRPGGQHDRDPGRRPRLVLLRRLLHREARRARVQRDPVGDDPRCAGGRRRRLRPARHHRHPRPRGLPRGADPVQGRHRRRGGRARRRVGPPAQPRALPGVRHLHAPSRRRRR